MLDFARKPTAELFAVFQEASERKDIGPHIVEKELRVCWRLRLLFATPEIMVDYHPNCG